MLTFFKGLSPAIMKVQFHAQGREPSLRKGRRTLPLWISHGTMRGFGAVSIAWQTGT